MRCRVAVLGMALACAIGSQAGAESLRAALTAAYNNNSTLNAQRAATRANDENLPQAKSGYRPIISATADVGINHSETDTRFGTTDDTLKPYGYGVRISQNLFNGFRTVNTVAAAKAGIRASRETLRNVEQNTLFSAASAYADVMLARELVSIRKRNLAFLREQLRSSQARLDVGEGTRTDVAQSDARLQLAIAQLSAAEAQLGAARGTYRQLTGLTPGSLNWPQGPRKLYPRSLEQALAIAGAEHPAIRATQHLVDAAAFNVKVAEGTFLPSINLEGSANQRYNPSAQASRNGSLSAVLNLSVPLYQGGQASSQVRQNKQTLAQRRVEVDQSRDEVRAQVVSAWTQLQSARANLAANRSQVSAAQLALEGVIEERNVGQRTQLDVLDSQSVLLQAQELLVTSRRAEVAAGYGLVAAIGRLNSRTLNLPVDHYTPVAHYEAVKDRWYGLRTPSGQ